MKMSDKLLIKKYRIRCLFIFITMILVFITFSVTDTKRLFYIQEQRDTILVKDLTLEQLNERIKKSHDIKNNEQYRTFLVNNSSIVIQSNYETMIKQNVTNNGNTQMAYGPPKLYSDIQDDSKPFGYENTTTKEMYLSREQINDKKRRLIKEEY